jgi:hypothetical protein
MIFCGQCGLQLAAGTTRCPRCGATIDETNTSATGMHADDPTIASQSLNSFMTRNPAGPAPASPAQPLILRPGANGGDHGSQMAYDATNRVEAPNYGTQVPQNPNIGSAYASNYPPQSGSAYPAQSNYPDFGTRASGTYGGSGYPMNTQQGYQQSYTQSTNRVRITAVVLILLGVLFVLIAVILFALQHANNTAGTATNSPTTITSTTSSDTQLAQQTVQQYYDDINKQNYQDAYNLWQTPKQSFAQFRSGFKDTKHDDVSFGNVTQQQDGTVKVTVTVTATEVTQQGGTQQSIYGGYYVIAKQIDNSWKITNAVLQKQ